MGMSFYACICARKSEKKANRLQFFLMQLQGSLRSRRSLYACSCAIKSEHVQLVLRVCKIVSPHFCECLFGK